MELEGVLQTDFFATLHHNAERLVGVVLEMMAEINGGIQAAHDARNVVVAAAFVAEVA